MNVLVIVDIDDFHWNYGGGNADVVLFLIRLSLRLLRPMVAVRSLQ